MLTFVIDYFPFLLYYLFLLLLVPPFHDKSELEIIDWVVETGNCWEVNNRILETTQLGNGAHCVWPDLFSFPAG